jgi:pimeloyl-ACP methyl ester carboxylesterase
LTKVFQASIDGCKTKSVNMDIRFVQTGIPKSVVIFCHGYKGFKDWGAWNLVANEFMEQGFIFVKFNFSHCGVPNNPINDLFDDEAFSENNYSTELGDLEKVIDWVVTSNDIPFKEKDLQRIHLIGHSRGGGIALLQGSMDARVHSIALWASVSDFDVRFPFGDALQDWKAKGEFSIVNGRTGQELHHKYQFYTDFQNNFEKLDIRSRAKHLQKPTLIIHAAEDEAVHFTEAMRLAKWISNSVLKILPQGGHTFGSKHPCTDSDLPRVLEEVVDVTFDFFRYKKNYP